MNVLRPEERAAEIEIEKSKRMQGMLKAGASTALGIGLTSKILPFMSEHIPVDLAIKGINKLSPKLGAFLKQGLSMGLNPKEGLNFIKERLEPKQQSRQPTAPQTENIIEQYSPNLNQFLKDEIGKGRSVLEAGALAQLHDKFKKTISKLEQDHQTNWSAILQSIFGGQEEQRPSSQPMQKQAQPQANEGTGQQALMSILQQIRQSRG